MPSIEIKKKGKTKIFEDGALILCLSFRRFLLPPFQYGIDQLSGLKNLN